MASQLNVPLLEQEVCTRKRPQYLNVNFLNHWFLIWAGKIIDKGNRQTFQQDMHNDLRESEKAGHNLLKVEKSWEKNKNKKNPLLRSLLGAHKKLFWKSISISLISSLLQFSTPILVQQTVSYILSPNPDKIKGLILVGAMVLTRIALTLINVNNSVNIALLGINITNSLTSLIYKKSLRFSMIRSLNHSTGSIMNYVQVDAQKFYWLSFFFGPIIAFPLVCVVGCVMLYQMVKWALIPGFFAIILLTYLNWKLASQFFGYQKTVMLKKDERMKISEETLSGIKYIKMSGWEDYFLEKVCNARDNELGYLKKQFGILCWQILTGWGGSIFINATVLGSFILLYGDLHPGMVFGVVSVFSILSDAWRLLPRFLSLMMEARVSSARIESYLKEDDIDTSYILKDENPNDDYAVTIENGSFYWVTEAEKAAAAERNREELRKKLPKDQQDKIEILTNPQDVIEGNTWVLKDINMKIKKGSFVAILGDVGSGKSAILYALLGEMRYDPKDPPVVRINGEFAFVGEKPWILNATVKENILFGKPMNKALYEDAIKYSCLESDLKILIKQDETEIGEKGVNLSGGQKARVSLARAIYSQADIYLFDDPLSAVDAHVGKYILKECFSGYLKYRTRILITHKLESLKYVDYVYLLKEGTIVGEGTYAEIKHNEIYKEMERKSRMSETSVKEITSDNDEKQMEEEEEKATEETNGSPRQNSEDTEGNLKNNIFSTTDNNEQIPEKDHMISESGGDSMAKIQKEEDKKLYEKLMINEDREIGKVAWSVWKAYFQYYGGTSYYVKLVFSMLLWGVIYTGANIWMSYWSERSTEDDNLFYFGVYMGLAIFFALICYIRGRLLFFQAIECSREIHKKMFDRIIRAPVNLFFDRVPIGRLLNRFSKDLTVIDTYLVQSFNAVLLYVFILLSDFFICGYAGTFWVYPVALLFFRIALYYQNRYMKVQREIYRLESITKSPVLSFFSESLNGLTSIRAYGEENNFLKKYSHLQDENIKNMIVMNAIQNWFSLKITLCTLMILVLVTSFPLLITVDTARAGLLGLLVTQVMTLNSDVSWFLKAIADFEAKLISLERCKAFTKVETEKSFKTENPETLGVDLTTWPQRGRIEFRNLWAKYRPTLPYVLTDLSFVIKGGEKIGIVGRTGSGKSTLFLTILRIIESEQGTILIDDVDISKLGLSDLRRKITIIPQDPLLYKGSLRDNLDLLHEHSDEVIWDCLEKVQMKSKFENSLGLLTEIKEGGENLSAGEKQLLCIARAILNKSKIILIDEATSNIDTGTEQKILNTIRSNFLDCTVLTIAHRLKTIISSDRILVMSQGRAVEFDSPHALLQNPEGHFYKLWKENENAAFIG